jgi:predicted phosphoribosyltransferase
MNGEKKLFKNRVDAGEQLAQLLIEHHCNPEIIIALPRGGIPVALPISEKLGIPMQILLVKKIGHPRNQEYAIGAVSETGELWPDESLITYAEKQNALQEAQKKLKRLNTYFPVLPALLLLKVNTF